MKDHKMRKFDFVVLGGGINGVCTALALVRRGLNVALVEQFTAGHERGSSHGQVNRLLNCRQAHFTVVLC